MEKWEVTYKTFVGIPEYAAKFREWEEDGYAVVKEKNGQFLIFIPEHDFNEEMKPYLKPLEVLQDRIIHFIRNAKSWDIHMFEHVDFSEPIIDFLRTDPQAPDWNQWFTQAHKNQNSLSLAGALQFTLDKGVEVEHVEYFATSYRIRVYKNGTIKVRSFFKDEERQPMHGLGEPTVLFLVGFGVIPNN